mgnify:CR=1 FL=1
MAKKKEPKYDIVTDRFGFNDSGTKDNLIEKIENHCKKTGDKVPNWTENTYGDVLDRDNFEVILSLQDAIAAQLTSFKEKK